MSNLARRVDRLEAQAAPTCRDPWHSRPYVEWPEEYVELGNHYAPHAPPQLRQCPTCGGEPAEVIQVRYMDEWPPVT
jgi:hypothetical protein